jgi:glucosylceramidase
METSFNSLKKNVFKDIHFMFILIPLMILLFSCGDITKNNSSGGVAMSNKTDLQLKTAEQYVTAEGTNNLLSKLENLEFKEFTQPDEFFPTIMLDPDKTFQVIEGFGGALTDAAAETFYKLPEEKQKEIITAYFDTEKGIGYNLCRTNINSCDFSSDSYAYDEVEGDSGLENFKIDHDLKYKIPLIKSAMESSENNVKLFASPWSPPAWMKTNNNMLRGGKLKPEYRQSWADYYVRFVKEYDKEGIPIWGITVQNEPMATQTWESCIYTAEDELDFVKNFLGPTLVKSGLDGLKLMIWDHNRGIMYQRAKTVFDDPQASKYVWGTAIHWYTGDHYENSGILNAAFPDKKILFTEGCVYPFNFDSISEWHWGERYGESILKDLNNSVVGWVDWNILLDETGGPNHVSNFCFAPVIGDTRSGEVHYMNSYYYIGHFSKFIQRGAKRIVCSLNNDDMLATAFINPDGKIVTVILNMTDNSMDYKIWIENKGLTAKSPAHSIITVVFN